MQLDWWTLALQTVNFLIVVWLLGRFLYHPVKRVIEEREAADRRIAELAEEKTLAADRARLDYEAKRAELAEVQRQQEAQLHAEMDAERQKMLEAARAEAGKLLADARARIERDRKQTLEDLGEQIMELACGLAEKALGEGRARDGDGLLQSVAEYLDALPAGDSADLRGDLADPAGRLCVVTADPMRDAQQPRWREAMAARFDGAEITFATDPAILGGVELRFPHAILSFSVADRLRQVSQAARA